MERPMAGRLRPLLSTSMAILMQAFAFTLAFLMVGLGWMTIEGLVWFWIGLGVGYGIGSDEGWIRRRWWKEGRWRWIWDRTSMFGDALDTPIYWLFITIPAVALAFPSTTLSQIAAWIYFPWSPDLARAGLVVCGVVSAFTLAVGLRVSAAYLDPETGYAHADWVKKRDNTGFEIFTTLKNPPMPFGDTRILFMWTFELMRDPVQSGGGTLTLGTQKDEAKIAARCPLKRLA
ncbi:hypothetical protein C8F01DRAFT_1237223 [Mycena amicta]|nr:hypothetical protein C8F01DRAFT_1237223 [Mycena amicta]